MKKKILIGVTILVVAGLALFALPKLLPGQEVQEGMKTLNIKVVDVTQDSTLFEGAIKTDAETLGDALEGAEELQMVVEEGSYGRFITSMMGVEQGSIEKGPWWLYESDNNESCKAQGMCMGIDETVIQDGDNFTFNLTATFN